MPDPIEKDERATPARWIADHAPFLASVALFLLVVIRVLRVSGFDVATAATLIREVGVVSLVLGVLVGVLPALLIGTAIYLIIFAMGGPGERPYRAMAWFAVALIWFMLTILLAWTSLIFTTLLLAGIFFFQRKWKWPLEAMAVVGFLVATVLDVPNMWLPPESIAVNGAGVTGYVLAAESEWTTILVEEDRSILIVRSNEVDSRTVCNLLRRGTTRTVSQVILGEEGGNRNPLCDSTGDEEPEQREPPSVSPSG